MDDILFERAKSVALTYLASQPRTERQVRERLARADVPGDVVDAVVVWATEWRYLDDDAFARAWVQSRGDRRRSSQRLLRSELFRQGVAREVIDDVLAGESPEADAERADVLARERVSRLLDRGVAPEVVFRRVVSALGRKGFPSGLSVEVVKRALRDADVNSV